ncbi:MAG TPA: hypothetical protein VMZ26_17410 [Pyrinomonadaceae bacterium]|nr:hypothetical protein [Pyrinomonadaceae bacterium]
MKIIAPLIICFAALLFPAAAKACVCDTPDTVEKAFAESTAIFTAKYIGSEYRKGLKSQAAEMDAEVTGKRVEYEVLVHKFEVSRWWKGGASVVAVLVSDHVRMPDGGEMISDCDLGFEEGKSYLIYAYGNPNELSSGACTRTKSLKRAATDLRDLKKLTSH